MIDPNKIYRTRDGREWKTQFQENSGSLFLHVYEDNKVILCTYLTEISTLADELRDQIPWEALRDDVQYVAMDSSGAWFGYKDIPHLLENRWSPQTSLDIWPLTALEMPHVKRECWRETLITRPEDR